MRLFSAPLTPSSSRLTQTPQIKTPQIKTRSAFHSYFASQSDELDTSLSPIERKVINYATKYTPIQHGNYTYHNNTFRPFSNLPMASGIQTILDTLNNAGSFDVITNPKTGLIQTSDTTTKEMLRQWSTDSAISGLLQRKTDPENWRKSMITNAAALNMPNAIKAVKQTLINPNWYRQGGLLNGVPHIYMPDSIKLDKEGTPIAASIKRDAEWENQKRVESQALMLLNLTETLSAGAISNKPEPWGFTQSELQGKSGQYITKAIANMTLYLMAINTQHHANKAEGLQYNAKQLAGAIDQRLIPFPKGHPNFKTPSASSWEETPFKVCRNSG